MIGGSGAFKLARTVRAPAHSGKAGLAGCALTLLLTGCSGGDGSRNAYNSQLGVSSSPRVIAYDGPVPKGGGIYKVGTPYQVAGRWYYPQHEPGYDEAGIASWYGSDFHGRRTANGEIYDMNSLTAAHKTLPMPSFAYVTNLENGRTILVRVNDRGPYVGDRLIDLSRASSQALGFTGQGLKTVRVRYAGRAPMDGNDSRERRYLASQPWSGPQPYLAQRPQDGPRFAVPYAPAPMREARNQGWTAFGYRSSLGSQR